MKKHEFAVELLNAWNRELMGGYLPYPLPNLLHYAKRKGLILHRQVRPRQDPSYRTYFRLFVASYGFLGVFSPLNGAKCKFDLEDQRKARECIELLMFTYTYHAEHIRRKEARLEKCFQYYNELTNKAKKLLLELSEKHAKGIELRF